MSIVDLDRAASNIEVELHGDWHDDPWGWPEIQHVIKKAPDLLLANLRASGIRLPALIDVPKENWGSRPAVVLDILDRLAYQALVDRASIDLIGGLAPSVYGWRLPPNPKGAGVYSRNNLQWDSYRDHLSAATVFGAALRSDLVSCFASMPHELVQTALDDHLRKGAVRDRIGSILEGFSKTPTRSGLPQRSLASAVIANMYLAPLDDVLDAHARDVPELMLLGKKKRAPRRSWLRWMDDIWLFGEDPADLRRAQLDIQRAATALGLNVNSAKTEVLEGEDVAETALAIEHSAVDDALETNNDAEPLEKLLDRLLAAPETAGRTSLRFAVARMLKHNNQYRIEDFPGLVHRMPHAADSLSQLIATNFTVDSLQDWFLEYASGPWASFEWAVAHYLRMFPSSRPPKASLVDFAAARVADPKTSLPLLASSAQRLAAWAPATARSAITAVEPNTIHPQSRRVLALAGRTAGIRSSTIRRWLGQHDENASTASMLDDRNYAIVPATTAFAR